MFKLVSKTNVLPRHLFIANIRKDPQAIAVGGFGRVFKGKYSGQLVALKMLYQSRRAGVRGFSTFVPNFLMVILSAKDSIEKNLYTEALAWRSLSHRFILPLLGIYEEGPQLFLVSPFMTNGALRDWRKEHVPIRIGEIRRLVRYQQLSEPSNNIINTRLAAGGGRGYSVHSLGRNRSRRLTRCRFLMQCILDQLMPYLPGQCTTRFRISLPNH